MQILTSPMEEKSNSLMASSLEATRTVPWKKGTMATITKTL